MQTLERISASAPIEDILAAYHRDGGVIVENMVPSDVIDELREAGLSELEILEVVQIVAIFNATNRLNAGLGIKVDDGAHDALRKG